MGVCEKRHNAFTLLELIVVFTIIIFFTTFGVPVLSNILVDYALYNASVQLQQDILLIQNLAITNSSNSLARFRIRFYPSQNRYIIEASEEANLVLGKGKLIERKLPPSIGFPMFFGKNVPESVVFGANSAPPNLYIDLSFNSVGNPFQGGGHINLVSQSFNKQTSIVVSVIGRTRIEWIKK